MPKYRKEKLERYVKLDDEMTETAAWTALSDGAVWNYIELRKSYDSKNGGNEHLALPYSKVAWRMSKGTFTKKMRELVGYGFVDLVEPGGLPKRPAVYKLSQRWKKKSQEIVSKEGREAIKLGLATKPTSRDNASNLKGRRT